MATAPIYTTTALVGTAALSAANSARDGTGTTVALVPASATLQSRVERIRIVPVGTTTAGMIRIFYHDGTFYYLYGEYPIAAVTPSATVPCVVTEFATPDLILPINASLRCTTEKAEVFKLFAFGGIF